MTEEKSGPGYVDIHEEFVQRIEEGNSKMKFLAEVTMVVAAILIVAYIIQLAAPLTGTTSVTVSLTDPTLVVTEVIVLALTVAWLYVGISNYRFTASLARQIAAARASEAEMEKKLAG